MARKLSPLMRSTHSPALMSRSATQLAPARSMSNRHLASLFRLAKEKEPCTNCNEKLQRKAGPNTEPQTAPAIVHEVLSSPGQPLDKSVRTDMEHRFGGADFSNVRIHTDAKAAESAAVVNARAYTVGQDVVIGENIPSSSSKTLAHELIHTMQNVNSKPHDSSCRRLNKDIGVLQGKSMECGDINMKYPGNEHALVESDYTKINFNSSFEYGIPGSSETGSKGWADIVDRSTPSIFEIKPEGSNLDEAEAQLYRYIEAGRANCELLKRAVPGIAYPSPRIIVGPSENEELVVVLKRPGILEYVKRSRKNKNEIRQPYYLPFKKTIEEESLQKTKNSMNYDLSHYGIPTIVIYAILALLIVGTVIELLIPIVREAMLVSGLTEAMIMIVLVNAGLLLGQHDVNDNSGVSEGKIS